MNMNSEIVIIGTGFAGASTAYHLSSEGTFDITIVEQESMPGMHSSGKNAALARQIILNRKIAELAVDSVRHIRKIETGYEDSAKKILFPSGSMLLASGRESLEYSENLDFFKSLDLDVAQLLPQEAGNMVKVLENADFETCLFCRDDGIVDINELLQYYLKNAKTRGVKLLYNCRVENFKKSHGRISSIATSKGEIKCSMVVNAAGAWASQIGKMASAVSVPLTSFRRHLFQSAPDPEISSEWPFVWDISHGIYFRPESGGLLLSPCDEEACPASSSGVDYRAEELLAEKITKYFPKLSFIRIMNGWSGLRTFASDRQFVIGFDPLIENFFWVAGLGGHGMTTSWSVGRTAASLIKKKKIDPEPDFSPARFAADEPLSLNLP
jgi:D-arginine dehydrogenase